MITVIFFSTMNSANEIKALTMSTFCFNSINVYEAPSLCKPP